jgi:hypothetical protein
MLFLAFLRLGMRKRVSSEAAKTAEEGFSGICPFCAEHSLIKLPMPCQNAARMMGGVDKFCQPDCLFEEDPRRFY